jgi:hypothetical protein
MNRKLRQPPLQVITFTLHPVYRFSLADGELDVEEVAEKDSSSERA